MEEVLESKAAASHPCQASTPLPRSWFNALPTHPPHAAPTHTHPRTRTPTHTLGCRITHSCLLPARKEAACRALSDHSPQLLVLALFANPTHVVWAGQMPPVRRCLSNVLKTVVEQPFFPANHDRMWTRVISDHPNQVFPAASMAIWGLFSTLPNNMPTCHLRGDFGPKLARHRVPASGEILSPQCLTPFLVAHALHPSSRPLQRLGNAGAFLRE